MPSYRHTRPEPFDGDKTRSLDTSLHTEMICGLSEVCSMQADIPTHTESLTILHFYKVRIRLHIVEPNP